VTVGSSAIFILVGGLSALWHPNVPDLVVACKYKTISSRCAFGSLSFPDHTLQDINVPIFVLFYVGFKIFKRTKIVRNSPITDSGCLHEALIDRFL
jgi:hypothetical protein